MFLFGVGLKLAIEHVTDDLYKPKYAWLLCSSFVGLVIILSMTRFTHTWWSGHIELFGMVYLDKRGKMRELMRMRSLTLVFIVGINGGRRYLWIAHMITSLTALALPLAIHSATATPPAGTDLYGKESMVIMNFPFRSRNVSPHCDTFASTLYFLTLMKIILDTGRLCLSTFLGNIVSHYR